MGLNDRSDSMVGSSSNETQEYPSATSHNQYEEHMDHERSGEDDNFQYEEDGASQVSADEIEGQGEFQIAQY